MPIVILSPGKQPDTRTEKQQMLESAYDIIFYDSDLANFYKQAIPIVNCYSGRDHHAPSCCVSAKLHNDFKIECFKQLGAKTVLEEIDTSFLTILQKNALTAVQRDIDHCELVFPPTSAAEAAAAAAKSTGKVGPVGPLLKEAIPSDLEYLTLVLLLLRKERKHLCVIYVVQ